MHNACAIFYDSHFTSSIMRIQHFKVHLYVRVHPTSCFKAILDSHCTSLYELINFFYVPKIYNILASFISFLSLWWHDKLGLILILPVLMNECCVTLRKNLSRHIKHNTQVVLQVCKIGKLFTTKKNSGFLLMDEVHYKFSFLSLLLLFITCSLHEKCPDEQPDNHLQLSISLK